MGFRFRRRLSIFPGLSLNISKTGVSLSAGIKGANVTLGKNGVRKTVGLPGSGLSYTNYEKYAGQQQSVSPRQGRQSSRRWIVIALIVGCLIVLKCYSGQ